MFVTNNNERIIDVSLHQVLFYKTPMRWASSVAAALSLISQMKYYTGGQSVPS